MKHYKALSYVNFSSILQIVENSPHFLTVLFRAKLTRHVSKLPSLFYVSEFVKIFAQPNQLEEDVQTKKPVRLDV